MQEAKAQDDAGMAEVALAGCCVYDRRASGVGELIIIIIMMIIMNDDNDDNNNNNNNNNDKNNNTNNI